MEHIRVRRFKARWKNGFAVVKKNDTARGKQCPFGIGMVLYLER